MNGRIAAADTPEDRLAAVVVSRLLRLPEPERWHLDYADFAEALRPFVQRELLMARMEERNMTSAGNDARKRELFNSLLLIEQQIAKLQLGGPK